MGPSGCGKSTLLHPAGALETPSGGRVLVAGRDLSGLTRAQQAELRRRDVGYVFQRLNLIPALTAVENVMLPLELDGVGVRAARPRATEALLAVGLDGPSPMARRSASPSPARSSVPAGCSWPTSRPGRLTPSTATRWWRCWPSSPSAWAPRW